MEPATQPRLYEAAEQVSRQLGLHVPLTLYQAQNPTGLNASLAYVPQEAHIVLHGPVTARLNDAELRALLAHELSHLMLWQGWDGDYLVVDQILAALTHDQAAEQPHFATARLFGLYNEIFCDRGALLVTEDPLVVVADARESLDGSGSGECRELRAPGGRDVSQPPGDAVPGVDASGVVHPGSSASSCGATVMPRRSGKIQEMIEGQPALADLDLLAQQRIEGLTRRLLDVILAPHWMHSEAVLAHARLFFDDYQAADAESAARTSASLAEDLSTDDEPLQDYYCYVLLDFVTSDRDLEELPLAAALCWPSGWA